VPRSIPPRSVSILTFRLPPFFFEQI
jgi:hypothetical protein